MEQSLQNPHTQNEPPPSSPFSHPTDLSSPTMAMADDADVDSNAVMDPTTSVAPPLTTASYQQPLETKTVDASIDGVDSSVYLDSTTSGPPPLSSTVDDAMKSVQPPLEKEISNVIADGVVNSKTSGPPPLASVIFNSGCASVKPANPVTTTSTTPNAWSKPLTHSHPSSASTILLQSTKDMLSDFSRDTNWPSLSEAKNVPSKRLHNATRTHTAGKHAHTNSYPSSGTTMGTQSLGDSDPEFPWASKLEKSKRNLHKVTSPEYLEDGTPKVRIPRQVLLEGLENQKEFVLGQFYRCSAPPPGLIQSVVSRIWGTRCRIFTRQIGNNSFLFHIPDEQTRKWVTQRGIWHVDDCIMFVSTWNPKGNFSLPEITTLPVWLTLKDIPHQLYSKKGISWIASGIGAPMLTSKPWLDPILMGEAKILVEVKLDRPFPQKVAIEDEDGTISMVSVIYSWLPPMCPKCGQLGHKAPRCLGLPPIPESTTSHITHQNDDSSTHAATTLVTPTVSHPEKSVNVQDALNSAKSPAPKSPMNLINTTAPGYVVIDTTQGFDHPILRSGSKENPSTIKHLMIPVMGSPVASCFSQHVPLQQSDAAHAAHSTTILETKESIDGLSSPTNKSLTDCHVETPAHERTTTSPLPATISPLSTTKAGLLNHNIVEDTPPTGIVPMTIVDPNNDGFVFGTQDTIIPMGGVFEPECGSHSTGLTPHEDLPTTRGGRQIKPTQKLQETDWKTVSSRRGRRGRGSYH